MELTTEVFVMIVFWVSFPICILVFRKSAIPGSVKFVVMYIMLIISNTCTVIEGYWFPLLFDYLEHFFISLSAVCFIWAVITLIRSRAKSIQMVEENVPL